MKGEWRVKASPVLSGHVWKMSLFISRFRRDCERISISSISLVKCEQIVRGSLLHNLILVKTRWIWNNQCGENKHVWGALQQCVISVLYSWSFLFTTSSALKCWTCIIFFPLPILWSNSTANPPSPTCHHLKVSSERTLFSRVIRGWMDWLKRSANHGSSSNAAMHCRQAHSPLEKTLSDRWNAYLKK